MPRLVSCNDTVTIPFERSHLRVSGSKVNGNSAAAAKLESAKQASASLKGAIAQRVRRKSAAGGQKVTAGLSEKIRPPRATRRQVVVIAARGIVTLFLRDLKDAPRGPFVARRFKPQASCTIRFALGSAAGIDPRLVVPGFSTPQREGLEPFCCYASCSSQVFTLF